MATERSEGESGTIRLREDGPFVRFWLAHTVTGTGTTVSYVVLPILVFQRTGSAAHTAAITAILATPYLLLGLLAGAVADRSDRRRLMATCELACAALMGSAPMAAAFGTLTLPHIYAVALGSATAFVFFDAANFGALPALVGQRRLVAAISAFESTDGVAHIAGPALGGLLATTIGPEQALAVDAASYLASSLLLLSVRRPLRGSAPVHRAASMRTEIGEGLRYLWQQPMIRALTVLGFGLSASLGATVGLLVVYGVHQLGLDSHDWRIGLLFSAGSAGALMASVAFPYVLRHVPVAWISLTGFGVSWVCMAAMAAIGRFEAALVAYFGFLAACQLAVINGIAYRQSATPDELRGRVNVVARMIAWGGQPFGAAIGGALGSAFGSGPRWSWAASGSGPASWSACSALYGGSTRPIPGDETDGTFSGAALDLIAGLGNAGCSIRARADIDTAGSTVVEQALSVAPNAPLWRFDARVYAAAHGLPQRGDVPDDAELTVAQLRDAYNGFLLDRPACFRVLRSNSRYNSRLSLPGTAE